MEISKQLVSRELAEKLKELGFPQDSMFKWADSSIDWSGKGIKVYPSGYRSKTSWVSVEEAGGFSAYMLEELEGWTPEDYIVFRNGKNDYLWGKIIDRIPLNEDGTEKFEIDFIGQEETREDATAKMLIYLAENNLIDLKKIRI